MNNSKMRYIIKSSLRNTLSPVARILYANKARIIMYHRFGEGGQSGRLSKSIFDSHCIYFKEHFKILTVSQLADHIHSQRKFPSNSLVITIDDGYMDLYDYAYPILKKYSIPATIYITTGFIEKELWLWPDKIRYILSNTRLKVYEFSFQNQDQLFNLKTSEDKDYAWDWITTLCLNLWDKDKQKLICQLSYDLDISIPALPIDGFMPVTREQIKEMSCNGIEFGSHTHSHPILSKLTSKDKRKEIEKSKHILENLIQKPVNSFCYPNGQKEDFDEETVEYVKRSGYKSATVAYRGLNDLLTDPYRITRITLADNMDELIHKLHGMEYLGDSMRSYLRKKK